MRRILLLLLMGFDVLIGMPTDKSDLFSRRLVGAGFENIAISFPDSDYIQVEYENRVYRHDIRAAGEVMRLLVAEDTKLRRVDLIPCKYGIPAGKIEVDVYSYLKFRRGEIDAAAFGRTLVVCDASEIDNRLFSVKQNRSFFKVDATITVGHQIQLGQYDDRLKFVGQIQPGLNSQFWPGNRVYAEAAVPFYDDIGLYDKGMRLARFGISQVVRLPYDVYAIVHSGIFMPERWGVSMEIASFWAHRHLLSGIKWDNTGFFYHNEGRWFYSPLHVNNYKIYLQLYPNWLDLMVGIDWNRYLLGDEGWRLTISRSFAETDIDVYFAVTDFDKFGGIQFRIPLPPSRRMRPALIRINWPNQYHWGYRATSKVYTRGSPLRTGLEVDTGFELPDFFKNLTKAHIVFNLKSWK